MNIFKKHVATYHKKYGLEIINWQEPGNPYHQIKYIIDNEHLLIYGDVGCAVYKFPRQISSLSFAKISNVNYILKNSDWEMHTEQYHNWVEFFCANGNNLFGDNSLEMFFDGMVPTKRSIAQIYGLSLAVQSCPELHTKINNYEGFMDWVNKATDKRYFACENSKCEDEFANKICNGKHGNSSYCLVNECRRFMGIYKEWCDFNKD